MLLGMSTATTLAFICSAGCPEIVAGIWILVAGGLSVMVALSGVLLRLGTALMDRPAWAPLGDRLAKSGGIGVALASLAFGVLFIAVIGGAA